MQISYFASPAYHLWFRLFLPVFMDFKSFYELFTHPEFGDGWEDQKKIILEREIHSETTTNSHWNEWEFTLETNYYVLNIDTLKLV